MRAMLDAILKPLREFFGRMTKQERTRLIILAVVVFALSIAVVAIVNRTSFGLLSASLSSAEAGEVYNALLEQGVEVKMEGNAIYVPENRVSDLRATLSAQGYFSNELSLDIIGNASGFSVTESQQKIYEAYQMGRSIDVMIMTINKIQSSKTLVNLGETSAFISGGGTPATASVMLTTKGGAALSNAEVNQIAEMVKASVPGIAIENISIKDSNLHVYNIGDGTVDLSSDVETHRAYEIQLERQLQTQAEQLFAPIFGLTNLIVSADVRLNFDKEVISKVEFSPPIPGDTGGIVRSASELFESQRLDNEAGGAVGTETNGMGDNPEYPYGDLGEDELYEKVLNETNYEINETRTQIEKAMGTYEKLSLSVIVDSEAVSEDYTAQMKNLAATALGIDVENITVERLPFVEHAMTAAEIQAEQEIIARQSRLREILESALMWGVILMLGLSFMSLVRMIVRHISNSKVATMIASSGGGGIEYLAGETEGIQYGDVELNAKPDGVEQLEKFIDKDARAVAQLLRNWLADD